MPEEGSAAHLKFNAVLGALHAERVKRSSRALCGDGHASAQAWLRAMQASHVGQAADAAAAREYAVKPLLVLDLDGTLLETAPKGTRTGPPSFLVNFSPTNIQETRLRPGLEAFLSTAQKYYDLGIFTAASSSYANIIVEQVNARVPGFRESLVCIFTRQQVTIVDQGGAARPLLTKDLRLVADWTGRPLSRILIVDDTPETYRNNTSNALPVPVYQGGTTDDALEELRCFLIKMPSKDVPLDVRGYKLAPPDAQMLLASPEGDCAAMGAFVRMGRASLSSA